MSNELARAHGLTPAQYEIIRRAKAPDATPDEFNLFLAAAQLHDLNPILNQISMLVFNKDKPTKRRMALIVTIDGLRAKAAKARNYRPDEDEPVFEKDPQLINPKTNPMGLVKATVKIGRRDEDGWHKVTGWAYWDELAPLRAVWGENPETGKREPTGEFELDTSGGWGKMPHIMLAKCAEANAIRRGWPDAGGLYISEEMDREKVLDLTATEVIEQREEARRLERVGADAPTLAIVWDTESPVERVHWGQMADRLLAWLETQASVDAIEKFRLRNRVTLQEFWARAPNDALEVKKQIEAKIEVLQGVKA